MVFRSRWLGSSGDGVMLKRQRTWQPGHPCAVRPRCRRPALPVAAGQGSAAGECQRLVMANLFAIKHTRAGCNCGRRCSGRTESDHRRNRDGNGRPASRGQGRGRASGEHEESCAASHRTSFCGSKGQHLRDVEMIRSRLASQARRASVAGLCGATHFSKPSTGSMI